MKEESPTDTSSHLEGPYRQPTAGEITAQILVKEHEKIVNRLKKEGIEWKKAHEVYNICNNCAIYEKNLTLAIAEDVYGEFLAMPTGCFGLRFIPRINESEKLVFTLDGECKGYVSLAKYKK